jgi:peptidoglycan/xylan/chitin deacetylase (PgdA/CDA1 family)
VSFVRRSAQAFVAVVSTVAATLTLGAAPASAAPPNIYVTFGFDDGRAQGQPWAGQQMAANGVPGTFYVNSAEIGSSGYYMTLAQIRTLQQQGHEIGGHTLTHARLSELTTEQQRREICDDRTALVNLGFPAKSFAYPFGDDPTSAQQIALQCGYSSARDVGGLSTNLSSSGPWTENVPPTNAGKVLTPGSNSLRDVDTLAYMKSFVTNAQNKNGGCTRVSTTGACWVNYVFHSICEDSQPNCNANGVTKSNFTALMNFIKGESSRGVSFKTAAQVMNAQTPPPPATPTIQNASLDADTNSDGIADCWARTSFGTNTATWSRVAGRSGMAEQVTVSGLTSGDRKIISAPTCAVTVTPGRSYTIKAWYKGTGSARFAGYIPNGSGGWNWWAQSSTHAAASNWTQVTWSTPVIPAGVTSIRFGESIFANGTLAVDDFSIS